MKNNTLAVVVCATCCLLFPSAAGFAPSAATSSSRTTSIIPSPRAVPHTTKLYNSKHDLFPKDEFDKDPFLDDDDEDDDDDDGLSDFEPAVADQIRKARALLADTKKKQKAGEEAKAKALVEATELDDEDASAAATTTAKPAAAEPKLPFFAVKSPKTSAADAALKVKSKTPSGSIIADGERMASLSKSEPWELRPIGQMFVQEAREDFDGNVVEVEKDDGKRKTADRDVAMGIWNLRRQLQDSDFKAVFDSRNYFIGDLD